MIGRPKGSGNKTPRAQLFIRKLEQLLKAKDPHKYADGLEGLFRDIMIDSNDEKTKALVLRTLIQYKLGMPSQPIEVSGELSVTETIRKARERALNVKSS